MIERQQKKMRKKKKRSCSFVLAWASWLGCAGVPTWGLEVLRGSWGPQSYSGPLLSWPGFPGLLSNLRASWISSINFFEVSSVNYPKIHLSNLMPLFYAKSSRDPQTLSYLPKYQVNNYGIGPGICISWFQGWSVNIGLPLSSGASVFCLTLVWLSRLFWKPSQSEHETPLSLLMSHL